MQTVKVGKMNINIVFDGGAWADFEEAGIMISNMDEVVSGKSRIRNMMKIVQIMGNRWLTLNGQEASLNSDRLLDTLKIPQFIAIQVAVMNEIAYGMRMETEDDDKEHDVVLEQIQKKSEAEG